MFPRSKLVRLSKVDKHKRPSHWIKSASMSVLCLNVTNLLTGSEEGVRNLPSILFCCNVKISKYMVDEQATVSTGNKFFYFHLHKSDTNIILQLNEKTYQFDNYLDR